MDKPFAYGKSSPTSCAIIRPPPAPRLGPQPSPPSRIARHGSRILWLPSGPVTLPGLRRVRVDVANLAPAEAGSAQAGQVRDVKSRSVDTSPGHKPLRLPQGLRPRSPSGNCADVVRITIASKLGASELEVAGAKLAERIGYWQLDGTQRRDVHLALIVESLDGDGDLAGNRIGPLGTLLRGLCSAPAGQARHFDEAVATFVLDLLHAATPDACAIRFERDEIGFAELYTAALAVAATAAADSPALAARLVRLALIRPIETSREDWRELPAETSTHAVHTLVQAASDRPACRLSVARALVAVAASGRAARDAPGFGMAGLGPVDPAVARDILGLCLDADLSPLDRGLLAWGLQIAPVRSTLAGTAGGSRRGIEGFYCSHIVCASWKDEDFRVAPALDTLLQAAATPQAQIELLRGVLAARAYCAEALQTFTDKQRTASSLRHVLDDDWAFDESMTLKAQFDAALPAAIARVAPHGTPAQVMELAHRLALGEARPMPRSRERAVCKAIAAHAAHADAGERESKSASRGPPAARTDTLQGLVRTGLALAPNNAAAVAPLEDLSAAEKVDLMEAQTPWTGLGLERMERMLADLEAGRHAAVPQALRAAILHRIIKRNLTAITPDMLAWARACYIANSPDAEAARAEFSRLAQAWQRVRGPAALPVVQGQAASTSTLTS